MTEFLTATKSCQARTLQRFYDFLVATLCLAMLPADLKVKFIEQLGTAMDEFDAIVGGAEAIRAFAGEFTFKKNPDCGNLTSAQFLVVFQDAEALEAFFEKGGRFTDQTDSNGRNAGQALMQRLHDVAAAQPEKAHEVAAVAVAYRKAIERQGGLIHVEEGPKRRDITARNATPNLP